MTPAITPQPPSAS